MRKQQDFILRHLSQKETKVVSPTVVVMQPPGYELSPEFQNSVIVEDI